MVTKRNPDHSIAGTPAGTAIVEAFARFAASRMTSAGGIAGKPLDGTVSKEGHGRHADRGDMLRKGRADEDADDVRRFEF